MIPIAYQEDIFMCIFNPAPLKIIPMPGRYISGGLNPLLLTQLAFMPSPTCLVATPVVTPCTPAPAGSWILSASRTTIGGIVIVRAGSILNCAKGGVITHIPMPMPPKTLSS